MKKDPVGPLLIVTLIAFSLLLILLPTLFSGESGRAAIERNIKLPLFSERKESVILAFFGYTGCADVCTPRLQQIGRWYDSLPETITQRSKFFFFDISKPAGSSMPDDFAKAFHPLFEGIYLDDKRLNEYTRSFDVYYAPSLSKAYEIDHTPHLYMLKKAKNGYDLRYIYFSYPYNMNQIHADMKELLDE